ncbi:alpha/beta fold hydrolase [Citrobacter freundii]|uniref:alpha/beta fold hydrolase n=1 Tax=Citrobacter freundii TaxID=546 RepID=UPI001DF4E765|nr:alpha/beta hydrolase [Citrobacter freundii]CAE7288959.1 AB hydrolase superfamily protein YdjP [Citrobacter freundii]CAH3610022.1 AB hydrolase superfamily protein YdjP [Citrobacter freundii]
MPSKLSEFPELQINSFNTSDDVKLTYWEAGSGEPLIFVPGWSDNGALYFHIIHILSQKYHVYVLDMRNHGLSQKVDYGNRISRFALDVKEFREHLKLESAYFNGYSMGVSILWSYIDSFGTDSIKKLVFVDMAPALYSPRSWSETELLQAGAVTHSGEDMLDIFTGKAPRNQLLVKSNIPDHVVNTDTPFYENVSEFNQEFIHNDVELMKKVLWENIYNDWRDVITNKINVPTLIITGECSDWKESQYWAHSVISGSKLVVYSKEEFGDHLLMMKNPKKYTQDLTYFFSSN